MNKKHLILTGLSSLLLVCFFLLPANQVWLSSRIFTYWKEFRVQKKQMSPDRRMLTRYGRTYDHSRFINDFFERKGNKNKVLVLLPSTAYFKKKGIDFHVPEPAVFYYYTGLKTVWANSPQAMKANWFVRAAGGKIVIDSVTGTGSLSDTIAGFKKFEIKL